MAVAHTIFVIMYHLLSDETFYEESRYDRCQPQQEDRDRRRAMKALERLGYHVTIERVA
jgi:hypothetical protein